MDDHHAFTAFQAIKNDHECQSCHGSEPIIAFIDIDTHLTSSEKNFNTGVRHFIFLGIALIIILAFGLTPTMSKLLSASAAIVPEQCVP